MATFIIPEEPRASSRRCDPVTRVGPKVDLGSSSECEVRIKDTVLAPRHCAIYEASEGFRLEDLGSGSGTYVDGRPATEPIPVQTGTEIVLGISKFTAEVDWAQRTITLRRTDFHFDYSRDPLLWSKSELGLGRFPLLRRANALALILLGVALGWLLTGQRSGGLLQPGPLLHASRVQKELSCDNCHYPFQRVSSWTCVNPECHGDLAANRHPFGRWEDASVPLGSDVETGASARREACRGCHTEHTADLVPPISRTPELCGRCHGERVPEPRDIRAEWKQPAPLRLEAVSLHYNTFSHRQHRKAHEEGRLGCASCHVLAGPGDERLPHSEFRQVTFERCMECHRAGDTRRAVVGTDFTVTWHGTEEGGKRCLQCHAVLHQGGPRMVTRAKALSERLFDLVSRSHAAPGQAARAANRGNCSQCHRRGSELAGGAGLVERAFSHATHVKGLGGPAVDLADCQSCHASVASSPSLGAGAPVYDGAECARRCHGDGVAAPGPAVPKPIALPLPPPAAQRDFPHEAHLRLEGGCTACHRFEPGKPLTLPTALTCAPCHDRTHTGIGGGACLHCHRMAGSPNPANPVQDDPVYRGGEVLWERPMTRDFRHASRGHVALLSPSPDCEACHSAATWDAETIETVPIPTSQDGPPAEPAANACRTCHVQERRQFHWEW